MKVTTSPHPRRRRSLSGVLLLAALAIAGCEQTAQETTSPPPKLVKAIKVADASGLAERVFPGRAKASREVNLSFRVSGPLITLPVNIGDEVAAEDVLARIDPNDFEARLDTVAGELETAKAQAVLTEVEYKRGKEIEARGGNLISKSDVDKRLGARNRARAQVNALSASLKLAKDRLSYTELKAPFDGVVVAKYVENFEDVLAKRPIVRLLDATSIEVVIDVPENLIGYAPFVESVTVRFDALPGAELSASIKEIGREASQTTRTFPVTLLMQPPKGVDILPGMAAKATVVSRPPAAAREVGIEIPATALLSGDDPAETKVFVIDEATKKLSLRTIEVSLLTNTGVLVKDGLEAGEWLVIAGVNSVKDGQEVRILDAAKEGRGR